MTAVQVGELAVVTGPIVSCGGDPFDGLVDGEVVKVIGGLDEDGDVYVYGYESHQHWYIALASLTSLSVVQADENVGWGDLLDPDYIHDYVFEGNE